MRNKESVYFSLKMKLFKMNSAVFRRPRPASAAVLLDFSTAGLHSVSILLHAKVKTKCVKEKKWTDTGLIPGLSEFAKLWQW